MYYVRTIAWYCVVALSCVSTLLAGTPQLRCVCTGAPARFATAPATGAQPCCCCTVVEEESETPSCCAVKEAAPSDDGEPAVTGRGCQKSVVQPEAASLARAVADVEGPLPAAAGEHVALPAIAGARQPCTSLAPFRELPTLNLQLLFQHFVI
jgi:hypothetical protein